MSPQSEQDNFRGVVASPPVILGPRSLEFREGFQPEEIRRYVLYWDKFLVPSTGLIDMFSAPEEDMLVKEGILERPYHFVNVPNGDAATSYVYSHVDCFLKNEAKNPGCWTFADTMKGFSAMGQVTTPNRGLSLELINAIPLPSREVPVQDLLEFKQRRRDELLDLRHEIDTLFLNIIDSSDVSLSLKNQKERIDTACSNLLKASSESKLGFFSSRVKLNANINITDIVGKGACGFLVGGVFGLPLTGTLGGILGSLVPTISLNYDLGLADNTFKATSNPYRYVASLHKELG